MEVHINSNVLWENTYNKNVGVSNKRLIGNDIYSSIRGISSFFGLKFVIIVLQTTISQRIAKWKETRYFEGKTPVNLT